MSSEQSVPTKEDGSEDPQHDWTFGLSDFDPSNPFLDDSALLCGLTPEWADSFLEQAQFQLPSGHRDHYLTSHEASSDEDGPNNQTNAASAEQNHLYENSVFASGRSETENSAFESSDPSRNPSAEDAWKNEQEGNIGSHQQNHWGNPHEENNADAYASTTETASSENRARYGRKSIAAVLAGRAQMSQRCSTRSLSASSSSSSSSYLYHTDSAFDAATSSAYAGRGSVTGRRKATEQARSVLMDWLHENREHPYPSRVQKSELSLQTGLTVPQIVHWMSNVRKRRLIPLMRGKREPASKIDRQFLAEIAARNT